MSVVLNSSVRTLARPDEIGSANRTWLVSTNAYKESGYQKSLTGLSTT